MMTKKDTSWIISLLICVTVATVEATNLEQHTVIEFLLQKVAELERNQQECSNYQSKMLLELNYVKSKLQDSERRISELEAIVYVNRSDDYTDNLIAPLEDEPVDKHVGENGTRVRTEDTFIKQTSEHKRIRSNKPGNGIRERREIASKHIAFSATIANGGPAHINAHETVRFDTVLHNEGNGYSVQTGRFTCPLSGTYFFSLTLMISPGYYTAVQLIVNGQVKVNSYAHGYNSFYDQGSISIVARCEAGHNVWVSMRDGSAVYGDFYTSFSGFYLWGDATGSR
ncbi:hypothetical protein ACJMK2_029032 [Sinanodonta woodiana]|uniref:C1q domain-containing protein n=1 Tax=Sinanodonta woodiana TaxID=1069815 RepID=A0ABD3XAF4_SINWO